jgi:hypothetical protein
VKVAKLRRAKATYSLSFVEHRPNTNVAILQNTGHVAGKGKGNKVTGTTLQEAGIFITLANSEEIIS